MASSISFPPQVILFEGNIKVCKGCHVKSFLIEGWMSYVGGGESPILRADFDSKEFPFTEDVIRHYFARHRWGLEYKASLMVQHQVNSLNCYNYELQKVYKIFEQQSSSIHN